MIPVRAVAIGDPQSSAERFFGALDAAELLAADGWLRPDVRLVSMGDHFDYHVPERAIAQVEGARILAWLAAHPRAQVSVLFGNHDAARVMELSAIDDARFDAAHVGAKAVMEMERGEARAAATAAFRDAFPEIAVPGYAARDYNAFTVEQRTLVKRLLLDRRFELAVAARALDGRAVLMTHAGIVERQLQQLEIPDEREPAMIAAALNARLEVAVAEVEADWRAGGARALSLEPLHVAGAAGKEGGGMLYHRPADPERPGADPDWEQSAHAPRRFDPRQLPRGLVQVIGHTGHSKAFGELPRWREDGMPAPTKHEHRGGLRTLAVAADGSVHYRRGVHLPHDAGGEAIVWMIDPEMHYVPSARDVAMLELGA